MTAEPELVGFDLETTGLEPRTDRIVQAVVGELNVLLDPQVPIPEAATAVHGYTAAHLSEHGLPYLEGLTRITAALTAAWERGALIVGHNIGYFDLPFLRAQEITFGLPRTRVGPIYDTYAAYKKIKTPEASGKLVEMCAALGVPLTNAHEAGADAAASVACARILRAGWTPAPERAFTAPSPIDTATTETVPRPATGAQTPIPAPPIGAGSDRGRSVVETVPNPFLNAHRPAEPVSRSVVSTQPPTTYAVVERLMCHPADGSLIRVTAVRDGLPAAVSVYGDGAGWSRSMSVLAGAGREVLDDISRHAPAARAVTAERAAAYGQQTGVCLLCGTALTDDASRRRGMGPECAKKLSR